MEKSSASATPQDETDSEPNDNRDSQDEPDESRDDSDIQEQLDYTVTMTQETILIRFLKRRRGDDRGATTPQFHLDRGRVSPEVVLEVFNNILRQKVFFPDLRNVGQLVREIHSFQTNNEHSPLKHSNFL